jgi:hypothetical protein
MVLEIRTYRLKPGTQADFVQVMREQAVPLLRAHGITVVDCGPSLVAEDGHEEAYLIRSFDSVERRDEQERSFYSGDAWLTGPREAVVSRIESYHTIVLDGGLLGH